MIIQVKNVPDDVAAVITEKARAKDQSVAAYLRDLMSADVERELRARKMRQRTTELKQKRSHMDLSRLPKNAGSTYVRQIRDEYDRGEA